VVKKRWWENENVPGHISNALLRTAREVMKHVAMCQSGMSGPKYSQVYSGALSGDGAIPITIECMVATGLPKRTVVGLPGSAVRECMDRIWSAMSSTGILPPRGVLTVNLAPADVAKHGTLFDLPIALGLILADASPSGKRWPDDHACAGELSLNGHIQPVKGILPFVLAARRSGRTKILVPAGNALEASHVPGVTVYPVRTLAQAIDHVSCESRIAPFSRHRRIKERRTSRSMDVSDVVGQTYAVDALTVAAAGGHNCIMIGPPGCGKTMLAERFTGILPEWSEQLALEANCIHSLRGLLTEKGWKQERPFRSPHHTISRAGMLGGGRPIVPGEASLAHGGVLFLDEMTQFSRSVLEGLREPLESRRIVLSRLRDAVSFPAGFQLIAAINPCPCGWDRSEKKKCTCSDVQKLQYAARLSGPILDRIDMHIALLPVDPAAFQSRGESTTRELRVMVRRAIEYRKRRRQAVPNCELSGPDLESLTSSEGLDHVADVMAARALSARSRLRILRIARTCADMDGSPLVRRLDVTRAASYRRLDGVTELGMVLSEQRNRVEA